MKLVNGYQRKKKETKEGSANEVKQRKSAKRERIK